MGRSPGSTAAVPPPPVPEAAPEAPTSFESLALAEGLLDAKQVERARRILRRLGGQQNIGEVLVELGQLARADYDRIVQLQRSGQSLATILSDQGALDAEGVARYTAARAQHPHRSERSLLVATDLVTEEAFLEAVSCKHDIPVVELEVALVDRSLLAKASMPYLRRHSALPIRIVGGKLNVAVADPLNQEFLQELETIYGIPAQPCSATAAKIDDALLTLDRIRHGQAANPWSNVQYLELDADATGDETGEEASQVVDYLLTRAIKVGASDLHIEPLASRIRVRTRIDGVMQKLTELPADFGPRVAARLKVLAGADIAEHRLHQDGRIYLKAEDRELDVRFSSYVSMHGETIVLRILDRRGGLLPLNQLGFTPSVLEALRNTLLRTASGLVLVTGPTGSGKTTTLYSFIDHINDVSVKVITAEDPVEYVLQGVIQCSLNQRAGRTFEASLRSIVRQDPDVIVIGEIRDTTTARMAIEAALTGHKVFATFHTDDSVGAVVRLLEMGVEPFLLASTLSGIVAQRLVRKVCEECKRPARPRRDDLRFLSLSAHDLAGFSFVEGAGCMHCNGTGFKGRIGIHEVLMPDDDLRDAVMRRAPSKELRVLARKQSAFLTLQEDGVFAAMHGKTTLRHISETAPRDTAQRAPQTLREIA